MVTDFHTHILPPWLSREREKWAERDATFGELLADPRARLASAEDLISAMDEDGVDRSVTMGFGWTDLELARECNDYIAESVLAHPDRLIGFGSVNPVWGDDGLRELERCAQMGLKGLGELHPDTQGFDLGDADTMRPILEVADELGLVVTTHSSEPVGHLYQGKGRTTPDIQIRFIENARPYPNVKIVCAHWGGGLPFYALMPEVKEALENVWFDTAASPFLYDANIYSMVSRIVGVDKVLLGSDYPLIRFSRLRIEMEDAESRIADFSARGPFEVPSETAFLES